MGLYYEDYTIGQEFITGRRTITEADIMNFGALTWDNNPLHTDQVFGETTIFGQRIGHGLIGLSYAVGLASLLGIAEGTTIAFLEVDQWKFVGPILIGDTIHCKMTVVEMRETKKPDRGIVTRKIEVINQRGEVIQEGLQKVMVKRKQD